MPMLMLGSRLRKFEASGLMVRWIATATLLAVLLMAGQYVQATDPMVISASCDGVRRQDSEKPDLVDKTGLIVDLGGHTVSALGVVAHIDKALPNRVEFSSEDISPDRVAVVTTTGFIDRVTGKMRITYKTTVNNEFIGTTVYDLVCKVANQLF
jgi:hypothetical protein